MKLLSHSFLSSFSPPPRPDTISFPSASQYEPGWWPRWTAVASKGSTPCLREAINIKHRGHSACSLLSHTWLRTPLWGLKRPAMGCSLHPEESSGGSLQEKDSGLDQRTRLWPEGLGDPGALLLQERGGRGEVLHTCNGVLAQQVESPSMFSFL